jgi:hypothetical protein
MNRGKKNQLENDINVNTWKDFHEVIYDIPLGSHGRHRSDYVYRGVENKEWGLETSLQRLGPHYAGVERPLLRSFMKYARPGDLPSNNLFFRLAVAQHHGLPTRVLDWTTSPRIAVHFAIANENSFDKDGAVWCIDVAGIRALLPELLKEKLEKEYAYLFSIEMLDSFEHLRGRSESGEPTEVRTKLRGNKSGELKRGTGRGSCGSGRGG